MTDTEGTLPGLNAQERDLLQKMFSDPLSIPPEWKAWLVSYLEANPPVLPISQIHGFSAFTANYAVTSGTADATVGLGWQALTHPGPSLTGLPRGAYIFLYGALYNGSAFAQMGPAEGGAASPFDVCYMSPNDIGDHMMVRGFAYSLTAVSNDISFLYKTNPAGGSFSERWLVALKYANL